MQRRNSKGFTLVEIMIVVVIIGLLAAMALPAFNKVRNASRTKAITNNLRQLAGAADQYFLENGVSTVNSVDLVGSTNYVKTFTTVAQEAYPAALTQGSTYTVTFTGGTVTYLQ
jgi:type IV pilus assembly protein PilA